MITVAFLKAAIIAGTPLLFATLGEIITEKAGNLNLGVEGMMLMGAVIGFQMGYSSNSPLLALIFAALAGGIGAFIYAFLTVSLRANQVVSGLALTIFGTGFAGFVGQKLVGLKMTDEFNDFFRELKIPGLGDIPYFGEILFNHDMFVYLGFITAIILGLYLYKTGRGLNLRAVGENPAAADAASVRITRYKYIHILIGGALCGLGGAYLSLVYVPVWQENITAGRGWIAVALVIFSAWNPYRAIFGAYLFGGLDIIGFRLQGTGIAISQYVFDMVPYVVTIIILVIVSLRKDKRNAPPKSLGEPYFREER
ncbi:MAG: ABC transporter permease [Gracilibacter sp. BRH_c7a]|nr:MAG: ABC transporter permease [Gracilibacter sp. BRH_c7a]